MSQTVKHAAGPWEVEPMEDGCSVSYRINDAHSYEIGVTSGRDERGEEEANARLIAAAPELLEALSALDRMNRGLDWCDTDEQARRWSCAGAALAKAEGRS